jgi:hypothetical protein
VEGFVMSDDKKDLNGKRKWSLMPWRELEQAVIAMEDGARKYGPGTWKNYSDETRDAYLSALQRHIVAWSEGELKDPVSGASHLGHAIANCLILIHHELAGKFNEGRE